MRTPFVKLVVVAAAIGAVSVGYWYVRKDKLEPSLTVTQVDVTVSQEQPITAVATVRGEFTNGCMYSSGHAASLDGDTFHVNMQLEKKGDVCTESSMPFAQNIELDVAG